jgi:16S rRNA (cytidine1402-2'-O)-methyltransferase
MLGTLYVVGTPIGNLSDISINAIDVLKKVDIIFCEDTRVTSKLLTSLGIKTATDCFHQHSSDMKMKQIAKTIDSGRNVALVTDAGMPGISDPGGKLLDFLYSNLVFFQPVCIPGPSAVTASLSICGFPADKYIFLGFPPNKNKREKYFKEVEKTKYTVVFYESCHRIKKTMKQLSEVLDKDRRVCICRELTKKFEQVFRGKISEIVIENIKEKGEFVVVVES